MVAVPYCSDADGGIIVAVALYLPISLVAVIDPSPPHADRLIPIDAPNTSNIASVSHLLRFRLRCQP